MACAVWAAQPVLGQGTGTGTSVAAAQDSTKVVDAAIAELNALAADGTETSVLLGIPTAAQRKRAEQAAKRALELLDQAAASAEAEIRRLEEGAMGRGSGGADAAARAEVMERELARLVDVEQAQRIPYYRGSALTVLACASDGATRDEAGKRAVETLSGLKLAGMQSAGEVSRRVMLAAAMLNFGGGEAGGALANDSARRMAVAAEVEHLDAAGAGGEAGTGLDAGTRERLALIRRVLDPRARVEAGAGLAEKEAAARGLLIEARVHPERRSELTAEACRLLLGALGSSTDPAVKLVVYAKVAAIIEPGVETAALPPEAVLARAVTLLREHADSVEARALLAQLVQRPGVEPALRATALWETAAAQMRETEPEATARAAETLNRLITEFAGDERAPAAARTVEAMAGRLARAAGAAGLGDEQQKWEEVQLRALDVLIANPSVFPSQVGEWKARAVAMRARKLEPATVTAEQIAPLVEMEATIEKPRPSVAGPALAELFRGIIDSPGWNKRSAAERVAVVRQIRRAREPLRDERLGLFAGEAELELGHPAEAAAELRGLIGSGLDQADAPLRPRVRLAYVAALRGAGLTDATRAEALTVLRQLTAPLDEAVVSSPRPEWYWRAWADSVEIAAGDAASVENVRAQIKRLEVIDPGLGGAETKQRFESVRRAMR